MLPRKERLSRKEFNRFFSFGKKIPSASFTLVYTPHEKLYTSVVVSKKTARTAVARNKARRRVYDIVRKARDEQNIHGVYIFLTKSSVVHTDYATLKEEVRKHLFTIMK